MEVIKRWDTRELLSRVGDILRDPTSNLTVALFLFAVLAIILLILVALVTMFVLSIPEDEEDEGWENEDGEQVPVAQSRSESAVAVGSGESIPPKPRLPWQMRLGRSILWGAVILAVGWAAVGLTTAQSSVCMSCHTDDPHKRSASTDPHQSTDCVACHETGGIAGAITFMVPSRVVHYATTIVRVPAYGVYGKVVPSSACGRCHATTVRSTVTVPPQGVRVSHKEPLAAGAECLDCHEMSMGVVSDNTVGMAPCLRCHDGKKVERDCSYCHTKDPGAAARSVSATGNRSRDRVGEPDCGGCHDQAKECDSCHGIRMPHTQEFKAWAHARDGVADLWFTDGRVCGKCHTPRRNPCSKCHMAFPNHPVREFPVLHAASDPAGGACQCHSAKAYMVGRNMCGLCHAQYR